VTSRSEITIAQLRQAKATLEAHEATLPTELAQAEARILEAWRRIQWQEAVQRQQQALARDLRRKHP
jgi:hypothetical protein